MNRWINTATISVHWKNYIISQLLWCCQPRLPSDLVRSAKSFRNWEPARCYQSCPRSWGEINLLGGLTYAVQWSRGQIPEAAPKWISMGTCWGGGKPYQLVLGSIVVCSYAFAPALLNAGVGPLMGHARLRLTPCIGTASVASVSKLAVKQVCFWNRGRHFLLPRQHANGVFLE